ncbi:hypothetical protein IQE94_06125 [Synechocystis sp. PCC 7339]|nr:hypothetical protein [Synechocystis sp. PCC 7339]UAJ73841.1 hypothetical protein IQE94_06125 [Synechocystis sp. PCC 7339]
MPKIVTIKSVHQGYLTVYGAEPVQETKTKTTPPQHENYFWRSVGLYFL